MYNSKTAKPIYYKLPIQTFAQLEKTVVRLQHDTRMGYEAKAKLIAQLFAQYKSNTFVQ
tara:strand:- start:359 stop:535 length:177 start_codon:yes stop_codon:yes gene_type:complete